MYGGNGEYYLRHKDSFKIDKNNLVSGQKLRKFTVIIYLNQTLPTQSNKKEGLG